jgi:DNA-binding transcriptional LysR family regulator
MWESLELRHLRAFLAVAEELHFGRAAERLHVTPSRVSQLVRTLETIVGGPLFTRTSRQVALTPTGARLRERIAPACDAINRAVEDLRTAVDGIAGELRLGVLLATSGGARLPEIIGVFESRHPACRVVVSDLDWADALGPLRRGEVDVTAIRFPIRQPDIVVGPVLATDARALAVAVGHPLASRASVSVEDLADYEVASLGTLPPELTEAFTPSVTPSGRAIRRRRVRGVVDNMSLVARGEIVHATVVTLGDYLSYPGVTYVPFSDLPPSEAGLIWRASGETAAVRAFARAAVDVLTPLRDVRVAAAAAEVP